MASPAIIQRPQLTTFANTALDREDRYYFKGNPWTPNSSGQKIRRFCVMCGEDRFKSAWSAVVQDTSLLWGGSPMTCDGRCWLKIGKMRPLVPDRFFSAERPFERGAESYDEVEDRMETNLDERIYPSNEALEQAVPVEYCATIRELEQLRADERVGEINHLYIEYKKQHSLPLQDDDLDVQHPFLTLLTRYLSNTAAIVRKADQT